MESGRRSLVKAVVWNVMGLSVMTLVGLVATGSATVGGAIAVVNTGIGFVMYILYERVWARVSWGRT